MIDKPVLVVASTGRTGTKFFARLFSDLVADGTALHEPDTLAPPGNRLGLGLFLRQLRLAGAYHLTVGKATGRFSLVRVSDARLRDEIDAEEAKRRILGQRRRLIERSPGTVYVESNLGYYGVIELLPELFRSHRLAYLIRDGRSWVTSMMDWGELYDKGALRGLVAHRWPTAAEIEDDPYRDRWPAMSRFERVCWAWAKLNGYALAQIERNPEARLFRFEDIFESERRGEHLAALVDHLVEVLPPEQVARDKLDGALDRRVNPSARRFAASTDWSGEQRRQFERHCAALMQRLGY